MKMVRNLFAVLVALTLCLQAFPAFAAAPVGFVETEVTPPKTVGEVPYAVALFFTKDGSIEYYVTHIYDTAPSVLKKYTSKDGGKTWMDTNCDWASAIAKKHGLDEPGKVLTDNMAMDSEGNLYFATWADEKGIPHAYQVKKDGSYKEIAIPSWQKDHNQVLVDPVGIAPDGNLLFVHNTMVQSLLEKIDAKSGALMQRVIEDIWQPTAFCGDIAVTGGMSNLLTFYDMNTGKTLRSVKLPKSWQSTQFGTGESLVAMDTDGTAYIVSNRGMERLPKNASVFETVMEGTRYRFGDKSCSFHKFYKQPGANVFYIAAMMDSDLKLYRYEAPGASK